jgi:hypothetical protein
MQHPMTISRWRHKQPSRLRSACARLLRINYAREKKARLIVLGVRRASMMALHVSAHIAYRIITEAPCPVLTVAFASEPRASLMAACF